MKKTFIEVAVLVSLVATIFVLTKGPKEKFVELAAETIPKTVSIYVLVEVQQGTTTITGQIGGAGVFISPNNHVLTCAHLFDDYKIKSIMVCTPDGICTAADILGIEPEKDLALLQSNHDRPTPYIELADPRKMKVGQEVMAVGNPSFLDFSVCHGIISALNRDIGWYYNLTQSDAPINRGNSGGPLVNMAGELIGINNLILLAVPQLPIGSGMSFSVQPGQSIEFVTRIRKQYEGLPKYNQRYFESEAMKGFKAALGIPSEGK